MRSQLNRIIVVGALVVVLPAIAIGERVREGAGRRVALRVIHRVTRLCGVTVEVRGADRLDDALSYVLVPNHTSPMDIVAVLVARPDVRFVAAAELFRIPLLGSAMRALDTVPITRGNRKRARESIDELARKAADRELVMFPEGKIALTPEVLPFKTGAFVVAIATGAPVVPVAIRGAAQVLPRRGHLRVRPGAVRIDVLEPLPTVGLDPRDRKRLAVQARDAVVEALAEI